MPCLQQLLNHHSFSQLPSLRSLSLSESCRSIMAPSSTVTATKASHKVVSAYAHVCGPVQEGCRSLSFVHLAAQNRCSCRTQLFITKICLVKDATQAWFPSERKSLLICSAHTVKHPCLHVCIYAVGACTWYRTCSVLLIFPPFSRQNHSGVGNGSIVCNQSIHMPAWNAHQDGVHIPKICYPPLRIYKQQARAVPALMLQL